MNRPYHSNSWMVILQRWEPIISPTFPSQIPFWIQLRGLPLHWHERMIYDIGQDLGTLEDYKITQTSTKICVSLDGLAPLPMETIVEFEVGEETLVTLEYEGLKRYCSNCNSLIRSSRYCSQIQTENTQYKRIEASSREENKGARQYSPYERSQTYTRKPPGPHSPSPHQRVQNHATGRDSSFRERVDRHGRPFGERVPIKLIQTKPLRNKITPEYSSQKHNTERNSMRLKGDPYQNRRAELNPTNG